jgi:hypothetical protein
MMVNENHFQFDRKSLLNLSKTIYDLKTVNHFLDLNSLFFYTRFWESVIARHWSLLIARIYRQMSPNFGIRLSESDDTG